MADGTLAAVSPDGRRLAYATRTHGGGCGDASTLVVRDLDTGVERRWVSVEEENEGPEVLTALAWSPDSRHLAYEHGWEGYDETRVLDTRSSGPVGDLDAGRDVEPDDRPGADRAGVAYRDAETLTTVRACCKDDIEDPVEERRLVAVDPATGAERDRLLDLPRRVASLDWDASGRHLAYVTDDGALWLWSGGEPRQLGSGFAAVAW